MNLERFDMIDAVETLDKTQATITARATVPETSPVFEGHFPGYPLLPGVLLLELMAQVSGFLLLSLSELTRMPFLASVKYGNFRSMVMPGSALLVTATREHDGSGYAVMRAQVSSEGGQVADATMMLRLLAFPTPELHAHMRARAIRLGLGHA